jgi:hypothetical protein
MDGEYEVFQVDTAIDNIMAFTTDTSKGGYQGKPNSNSIPLDEWNKLSQDQKDQMIAKRRKEQMKQNGGNWKSKQPRRQVNEHDVNDLVHVDTLIDYAIMNHDVVPPTFTEETTDESPATADTLLAYMACHGPEGTTGDIRNVLAAKREPDNKNKSRTANEGKSAPSTVKIADTTYYLNKVDTITFQGHQYFAHMTMTYRISQHDVATMDKALVDSGANGGIVVMIC